MIDAIEDHNPVIDHPSSRGNVGVMSMRRIRMTTAGAHMSRPSSA